MHRRCSGVAVCLLDVARSVPLLHSPPDDQGNDPDETQPIEVAQGDIAPAEEERILCKGLGGGVVEMRGIGGGAERKAMGQGQVAQGSLPAEGAPAKRQPANGTPAKGPPAQTEE